MYVREGRGRVEVCVVVYEPYQAPFRENFTVTIATEDGLAGRTNTFHIVYIAINFTSEKLVKMHRCIYMYIYPTPSIIKTFSNGGNTVKFVKVSSCIYRLWSIQYVHYGSLNQLVIVCKIISSAESIPV